MDRLEPCPLSLCSYLLTLIVISSLKVPWKKKFTQDETNWCYFTAYSLPHLAKDWTASLGSILSSMALSSSAENVRFLLEVLGSLRSRRILVQTELGILPDQRSAEFCPELCPVLSRVCTSIQQSFLQYSAVLTPVIRTISPSIQ